MIAVMDETLQFLVNGERNNGIMRIKNEENDFTYLFLAFLL